MDAWIKEKYPNPSQIPARETQGGNKKAYFLRCLRCLSSLGVSKCEGEKNTYILDMKHKEVRLTDAIITNRDWKSLRKKYTNKKEGEENTKSIPWVVISKELEELLAVYDIYDENIITLN